MTEAVPRIIVTIRFPPELLRRLIDAAGRRGNVVPMSRDSDELAEALRDADAYIGNLSAQLADAAGRLRWVQLQSAGVPRHVRELPERVVVTNARGVHSIPMAEHVVAVMLALVRDVRTDVRWQVLRQWKRPSRRGELLGSTCVIVGYGDIGHEIARRLACFGVRIVAVRRSAEGPPPPGVERVVAADRIDEALAEADHVVVTLPATDQTRGLFNDERIARIKRGAFFYNVGRGVVVDETALLRALRSGHLAGAALDVFEREPLPRRSGLWSAPNTIVSPHASAGSPRTRERWAELFARNVRRFVAGEPLENVVDRRRGY